MDNPQDLSEELDEGQSLANKLVAHLASMGASQCAIPVTFEGVEYVVEVRPATDDSKREG